MLRIGFLVSPGFQVMNFAALSVFEFANLAAGEARYDVAVLSEHGGHIGTSMGLGIDTVAAGRQRFDTLIVGGGTKPEPATPGTIAYVRKAMRTVRRMASICTGASVLAQAGLLDGRKATTHWAYAREMQAQHPAIDMQEDRIYVSDGPIWTSAGMSAGIDLALAMVEDDLGAELAREVARQLVVYHRRSGGQSQFSTLLTLAPKTDRIQKALSYARQNLREPLAVEALAEAASLSVRQFSRAFQAETGQSPAKAVEHLRVEAARLMMDESRHSIDTIARETGFADRERMRRAFLRAFGQSPQAMRRLARRTATADAVPPAFTSEIRLETSGSASMRSDRDRRTSRPA
jgi:transcriptional regulator GlxA family with amidase domain